MNKYAIKKSGTSGTKPKTTINTLENKLNRRALMALLKTVLIMPTIYLMLMALECSKLGVTTKEWIYHT